MQYGSLYLDYKLWAYILNEIKSEIKQWEWKIRLCKYFSWSEIQSY